MISVKEWDTRLPQAIDTRRRHPMQQSVLKGDYGDIKINVAAPGILCPNPGIGWPLSTANPRTSLHHTVNTQATLWRG